MRTGLGSFSSLAGPFGTGCWLAWIMVIYSGDSFLAEPRVAYEASAVAFFAATFALSVALVVLGAMPQRADALVHDARVLAGMAIVGSAASVGASFLADARIPLALCSIVAGAATSVLALRCAMWTAELESRDMLVGQGIALVLGVLIYAFASALGVYFGSAAVVVLLATLQPMSAFVLSSVGERYDAAEAPLPLPRSFWKLIAFMVVLAFALCSIRGYYPNAMDVEEFAASRMAVALILLVAMVVVVTAVARLSRKASFGYLFYGVLLAATLAVALVPLLGFASYAGGVTGSILFGIVLFVDWSWLSRVSYRSGASVVRVFGYGFGAVSLGTTAGFALGSGMYAFREAIDVAFTGFTLVVVCLVGGILLLRKEDIADLMVPVETEDVGEGTLLAASDAQAGPAERGRDPESPSAVAASREAGAATEEAPLSRPSDGGRESAAEGTPRPQFKLRCRLVAEQHGLSARESEVFFLLAKGKDAQSIADELFISFNTARTHIRHVYAKLDVHSKHELIELVDRERIEL